LAGVSGDWRPETSKGGDREKDWPGSFGADKVMRAHAIIATMIAPAIARLVEVGLAPVAEAESDRKADRRQAAEGREPAPSIKICGA
jgi:hypothetical protein